MRTGQRLPRLWAASCALLLGLTIAQAHPTTGYVRLRSNEQQVEVRLTLALSALSDLTLLDANNDKIITRQEVAAVLPQVRDRLTQALVLKVDGEPVALNNVTSVDSLWPADHEAGGTEGFTWEACFMDITFSVATPTPSRPCSLDLALLFRQVPSLGAMESTGQFHDQPEATITLPRDSPQPVLTVAAGQALLPEQPAARLEKRAAVPWLGVATGTAAAIAFVFGFVWRRLSKG